MTTAAAAARRLACVLALAVALVVSTVLPASAAFSASSAVSASVGTATVAPPGAVDASDVVCRGRWTIATISWTPSEAAKVTGYTVRVHPVGGTSSVVTRTHAGTTNATYLDRGSGPYTFSVTTETAYGWTAESPRTAEIGC